mmetsp:Transcript_14458/g.60327  ORF Transcript_14458/g.60327 Transcript_14458/m.60327 type:complete len:206 (-) Transcript_14458:1373-1990(-)
MQMTSVRFFSIFQHAFFSARLTTRSTSPRRSRGLSLATEPSATLMRSRSTRPLSVHIDRLVMRTRARSLPLLVFSMDCTSSPPLGAFFGTMTSSEHTMTPLHAMVIRSSIAISAAVPTPLLPSLYSVSTSYLSSSEMPFPADEDTSEMLRMGLTPTICPLRMTVVCLTLHWRASAACSCRNAYSPCTGRKCCGCTMRMISSCSSR